MMSNLIGPISAREQHNQRQSRLFVTKHSRVSNTTLAILDLVHIFSIEILSSVE